MVSGVLDALRGAACIDEKIAAPAWLDKEGPPPAAIIACANGLLHLPTRRLLSHTPAFFNYNALDFDYDPRAPEPRQWLAFLTELWPEDAELIATLQQFFGYFLAADTSLQKALMLIGPNAAARAQFARAEPAGRAAQLLLANAHGPRRAFRARAADRQRPRDHFRRAAKRTRRPADHRRTAALDHRRGFDHDRTKISQGVDRNARTQLC